MAKLDKPNAAEVLALSRGLESAVAQAGRLTETQELLLRAICLSMTGFPATIGAPAITPTELAEALAERTPRSRRASCN